MKIVIYTVADCKYSAEEKTYLQSHNLTFEEHDVEKDHTALETMLKVGNNFAGTPVTQVTKDDGQELILKGFTAEEFDEALGFKKPEAAPATVETTAAPASPAVAVDPAQAPAATVPTDPTLTPAQTAPVANDSLPNLDQPPVAAPAAAMNMSAATTPVTVMQTESTPSTAPNPLDNILKDLQTQLGDAPAPAAAPSAVAPQQMPPAAAMNAAPPQPAMPAAPVAAAPVAPPTPVVPDFPKV